VESNFSEVRFFEKTYSIIHARTYKPWDPHSQDLAQAKTLALRQASALSQPVVKTVFKNPSAQNSAINTKRSKNPISLEQLSENKR
jgi:hypothetical protein